MVLHLSVSPFLTSGGFQLGCGHFFNVAARSYLNPGIMYVLLVDERPVENYT